MSLALWDMNAALGISGVTLCVLLLYLLPSPTYAGAETFGPASDFLANPDTPRFMAIIIGASVCNGLSSRAMRFTGR